jgi:hypothetical protein
MNKLIVFLLIVGIGFQSIGKLFVLAWYQVNKTYIAQKLCENRNKPKMHCNGKCQLRKKMQQLEQDSPCKPSVPAKIDKIAILEFLLPANQTTLNNPFSILKKPIIFYDKQYTFSFSNCLLKPPRAL